MIVVSDASPLINLAIINRLDLLHQLYNKIVIPRAVFEELTVKGKGQPGDTEIKAASWVEIQTCKDRNFVSKLQQEIDLGEAEAITLAIELNADLLLIDENLGRAKAKEFHLSIIGLLGVLLDAKQQHIISNVTNVMDQLRNEANFRIGEELYQRVKMIAGE